MKIESRIFGFGAFFFVPVSVIYGFLTGWTEWVGILGVLLLGGLAGMIGAYLALHRQARRDASRGPQRRRDPRGRRRAGPLQPLELVAAGPGPVPAPQGSSAWPWASGSSTSPAGLPSSPWSAGSTSTAAVTTRTNVRQDSKVQSTRRRAPPDGGARRCFVRSLLLRSVVAGCGAARPARPGPRGAGSAWQCS